MTLTTSTPRSTPAPAGRGGAALIVAKESMHLQNSDLIGIWFISNIDMFPEEDGILVLRPDGICIQFPSSVTLPPIGQTFRLWFSLPDINTIEFKMKPDGRAWLRFVERNDKGWTMRCDEQLGQVRQYKTFPCRPAKPEELPGWFAEMMEKNLEEIALLLERESTAEQAAGAGQPAVRPMVETEVGDKSQPEAEGRSR